MAWTLDDIPDQTGKTAVVTGANGGLGLETAKALAGKGAHVVMAARDQEKALTARDMIHTAHPDASTEIVELDLGSLASVASAASTILASHPKIDLLVNNAGLMALPERATVDGFEMQFGVNHLGHWALTAQLMPAIATTDDARVVTVTSFARLGGRPVDPSNPHLHGTYSPWKGYNQSKLANYLFAIGLQRDFTRDGIRAASLAAHPGLSHTEMQSRAAAGGGTGRTSERFAATTGLSPAEGALPLLRAATDPEAKGGEFYGVRFVTRGPAVHIKVRRRNLDRDIATLWQVSQRETGLGLFDLIR